MLAAFELHRILDYMSFAVSFAVLLYCCIVLLPVLPCLDKEWRGVGSFWVGAVAMAAGTSGIYVTQGEPSGGVATVFYALLSLLTCAASVVSIFLGEGASEG